ncbi:MAG: hypothetical protein IJP03_01825 [Christensenellaceae bacterium]|nr:hypothetical protein [Christensenellaceae bacterium]
MKRFVAILLAAMLLFALAGCDGSDYKKATQLYEQGEFAEAKALFKELDDYKDSKEMVKACDYGEACALLEEGEYEDAAEIFEDLDDYSDSAEKVKECSYALALQLMEEGSYMDAVEIFAELEDYEDSKSKITECGWGAVAEYIDEKGTDGLLGLGDIDEHTKASISHNEDGSISLLYVKSQVFTVFGGFSTNTTVVVRVDPATGDVVYQRFGKTTGSMTFSTKEEGVIHPAEYTGTTQGSTAENSAEEFITFGIKSTEFEDSNGSTTPTRPYQAATVAAVNGLLEKFEDMLEQMDFPGDIATFGFTAFAPPAE